MKDEAIDLLLVLVPSPNVGLNLGFDIQAMPPLGLGYIATYVSKFDYCVKVFDLSIPQNTVLDLIELVISKLPKIVGISTTTETYKNGVKIAKSIKDISSDIYIVMGGAHVTFMYEDALKTRLVDFVIRGEGEHTMKALCESLIRNKGTLDNINGLSYVEDGCIINNSDVPFIENLDELPFPDRSFFELDKYPHKGNCSTSRGCPGKCIFCASSGLSGGKYRMRSAKNIVKEFEYLKGIGCNHIDIVDDTMTASILRLNEILDLLIEKNLGITWYCESRVDVMSKELLTKMKQAGLTMIQFGVEAGNQEMLDCLKKNITIDQIQNVFKWCRELEIRATSNMIIGQPYDTEETINETIILAKKIVSLGAYVNFTICTPYPGTYMWDHTEELGIKIIEDNLDKYTTFFPVLETRFFSATEIRNQYYKASIELLKHRKSLKYENEKGLIRFNEQIMTASNSVHQQFIQYKVEV